MKQQKDFLVYYRAWRDQTMQGVNTTLPDKNWLKMTDLPYGIQYINIFSYVPEGQEKLAQPFFDKLKAEYAPALHARGAKLIRGFDYSRLLGVKSKGEFPTEEEFDNYAKELLELLMYPWNLDGLDVDMETNPTEEEVRLSDGVIRALSKYIGPKANNGTVFFYDTNNSNLDPIKNVADCFDYVAYQQYGSDANRTAHASNDFSNILPKSQFMPGLTFPEEGDAHNRWFDTDFDYEKSNFYQVASFVKENDLGGMFIYAPDRDGRTYDEKDLTRIVPSNFLWTKTALQEVNGWSLEDSQKVALHYLEKLMKTGNKIEIEKAREKVIHAKNLLEVNMAILGKDYEEALSLTYDPLHEVTLMES